MTSVPGPAPAGSGPAPARPHVPDWFERPGSIVFIAALMGLLSLAVELCLPALPYIAADFGLANANAAQSVITVFILSFGAGHLFQGLLADRFGRKPVLVTNLAVYGAAAVVCALTPSFEILLAARAVQGAAAAGCRVVGTAVLRDVKDGAELARSMSVAMVLFTAIPVVAPFLGQAVVLLLDYRAVFALLAIAPAGLAAIAVLRLPETLPPPQRVPLRLIVVLQSLRRLVASRDTLVYTIVGGILYGTMFGFIASAPQIYFDVYAVPMLFPLFLSLSAFSVGLAAFLSSRMVRSIGARRLVFLALCLILPASAGMWVAEQAGMLSLAMFQILILLIMFGNGLAFANCNVLAIQPHPAIAGIASSMVGGAVMMLGAVLSHVIGQAFEGTLAPLATALLCLTALTMIIERAGNARRGSGTEN